MPYTEKQRLSDYKKMHGKNAIVAAQPVFRIFKEGSTTDGPVTILRELGKPYDVKAKKKFYRLLGFKILPL